MEHEYANGDIVKVKHTGHCYSTYHEWANKHAPRGTWKAGDKIRLGERGTVIAIGQHCTEPRMLKLVQFSNGRSAIFNDAGISFTGERVGTKAAPVRFIAVHDADVIATGATENEVRKAIADSEKDFDISDNTGIVLHEIKNTRKVELGIKVTFRK